MLNEKPGDTAGYRCGKWLAGNIHRKWIIEGVLTIQRPELMLDHDLDELRAQLAGDLALALLLDVQGLR